MGSSSAGGRGDDGSTDSVRQGTPEALPPRPPGATLPNPPRSLNQGDVGARCARPDPGGGGERTTTRRSPPPTKFGRAQRALLECAGRDCALEYL